MKIFKREKEVTEKALEYVELVSRCVSSGQAAVGAYLRGEIEAAAAAGKTTSELESEADDSRRAIGDLLFMGAYLPLIRGDLFSVIEAMDNVSNAAESCGVFFMGERPEVPEELRASFIELTDESFGVIKELRKAVRMLFKPKGDFEKIRKHVREVSICESKVDELEWALTERIFGDETMELAQKRHLRAAAGKIAHVSDVAENVGERLELAAMKSVL